MTAALQTPEAVVFDMGGVLVDWNPDYLYRELIPDAGKRRAFLDNICTQAWHEEHDGGMSFAENAEKLIAKHPDAEIQKLIRAWGERFQDMIKGTIDGTVEIVNDLVKRKIPLFGLTNWPEESFLKTKPQLSFLHHFRDVVVSGTEKMRKPDPKIYELLVQRSGLRPSELVFIDDREENLAPARAMGWHTIRFTSPAELRLSLQALGLL